MNIAGHTGFDDLAKPHHCDVGTEPLDYGKIMRDQ